MFRKLTLVPIVAFALLFAGYASASQYDPGPDNGSPLRMSMSDMW